MKTEVDGVRVMLVHVGEDRPAWDKEHQHRRYTVVVGAKEGIETFDFWGSVNDYEEGKDPDPKDALEAVLSDALSGADHEDVDSFSSEFGYTKPSEAIRAFEECKQAYAKLKRLGLDRERIAELLGKVQEMER